MFLEMRVVGKGTRQLRQMLSVREERERERQRERETHTHTQRYRERYRDRERQREADTHSNTYTHACRCRPRHIPATAGRTDARALCLLPSQPTGVTAHQRPRQTLRALGRAGQLPMTFLPTAASGGGAMIPSVPFDTCLQANPLCRSPFSPSADFFCVHV